MRLKAPSPLKETPMSRIVLLSAMTLWLLFAMASWAGAEPCDRMGCGEGACRPTFGGYCDKRPGGCYGAPHPVNSPEEARTLLVAYYADQQGVVIGRIGERRWGYEAEILDRNNAVIDRVMVHRHSGRIRSLF
jgi:hypothetical protein